MPKKINNGFLKSILLISLVIFSSLTVYAHEDDYIVGLSAFRDGLYDISTPSLEAYLKGETDPRKADYAHYLLYQTYLNSDSYTKSVSHLKAIEDVKDRRFDTEKMQRDKMVLLTKTDCDGASVYLKETSDETVISYFLDSECKLDEAGAKDILTKVKDEATKLKIVVKFEDKPEIVTSVFDSLDMEKMEDNVKKYFALYFYKHGDGERFRKIREVYEDADLVGIELDQLWQANDKAGFIAGYEKYNEKYKLLGVNACRAIDVYKKDGKEFDCNLVNECIQKYTVEFVQVKGACLVKKGDKTNVTEFIDSLKPTIFPGMCGYGEYIFNKGLYEGKAHSKFYQCDERYKIADMLLSKNEYQAVINMFHKKTKDLDLYYYATALKRLGKTDAGDKIASKIKDEKLKAKYAGGTQ